MLTFTQEFILDLPLSLHLALTLTQNRAEGFYRNAVTSQSPGLPGFGGYPGIARQNKNQPQGGCAKRRSLTCLNNFPNSTFDATALRLFVLRNCLPRVAAKARQPWALGRNRVAVGRFVLTATKRFALTNTNPTGLKT